MIISNDRNQHGFSKERLFLINLISIFMRIARFMGKGNITDSPYLIFHKAWGANSVKKLIFLKLAGY